MTKLGESLLRDARALFEFLRELEKESPGDVDIIVRAIVDHLRAWKPTSVAPLGVLPAPTERIRDPRREPNT